MTPPTSTRLRRGTRGGLALLCMVPLVATLAHAGETALAPEDARQVLFAKMDADGAYFRLVLDHQRRGQVLPGLTPAAFEREARRARHGLPVVERFQAEASAYAAGTPLSVPERGAGGLGYANVIALLNMLQARERRDPAGVLAAGARVDVDQRVALGPARGGTPEDSARLYRLYFFLMGEALHAQGDDARALEWFARLGGDAELAALKARAQPVTAPRDPRAERLRVLRTRAVAVVPFEALSPSPDDAWVGDALLEILSADVAATTALVVVERARLAPLDDELAGLTAGLADGSAARDVGARTGASSILVGSHQATPTGRHVWLRLVDAEAGQVLGVVDGDATADAVVSATRELLLALLRQVGWHDAVAADALRARPAASVDVLRRLSDARRALSDRPDDAGALFARATREAPAIANLFTDLRHAFPDARAHVAVLPFTSSGARADERWRAAGLRAALASDLPALGFVVVDGARVDDALGPPGAGAPPLVDVTAARDVGARVDADLVLLGDVLAAPPRVRVDVRVFDVRTGALAFVATIEDTDDDAPALLRALASTLAAHFNAPFDAGTEAALRGARMEKASFERFAREQEAVEAARFAASVADDGPRATWPFWSGLSAAISGGVLGALGVVAAQPFLARAWQLQGLQQAVADPATQSALRTERDQNALLANAAGALAVVGVAIASTGLTVLVVDAALAPRPEEETPPANTVPRDGERTAER